MEDSGPVRTPLLPVAGAWSGDPRVLHARSAGAGDRRHRRSPGDEPLDHPSLCHHAGRAGLPAAGSQAQVSARAGCDLTGNVRTERHRPARARPRRPCRALAPSGLHDQSRRARGRGRRLRRSCAGPAPPPRRGRPRRETGNEAARLLHGARQGPARIPARAGVTRGALRHRAQAPRAQHDPDKGHVARRAARRSWRKDSRSRIRSLRAAGSRSPRRSSTRRARSRPRSRSPPTLRGSRWRSWPTRSVHT